MRRKEPPAMGRTLPTLKRAWPKDGPLAAICVQSVDVQCVLQFTLVHAAGCVLHRRTSRVIHRLKLCVKFVFPSSSTRGFSRRGPGPQRLRAVGPAAQEDRRQPREVLTQEQSTRPKKGKQPGSGGFRRSLARETGWKGPGAAPRGRRLFKPSRDRAL